MNGLPYYKAYPRDFVEGTIGMPFEVKCAYRVVIDLIYMQGGHLPDDDRYISGHLGCSIRKWKSIRSDLIESGKIVVLGEFLTNKRADKELETLAKLQEKQRENRSRPNKNKDLQSPRSDHTEPEPDIKEDTKVSSQKTRGSRLSDDWVLPREWGEWALAEGWPEQVIRDQADRFRDYWISKTGQTATKRDWSATWRNWMRNSKSPKVFKGGQDDQATRSNDRLQRIISAAAGGTSGKDWG
jgi:uncharacterized protein YdaU (DUF1376 family)